MWFELLWWRWFVKCSFFCFGHHFPKYVIVCPFFSVVYVIFMELQVWNIVILHHLCEFYKTIHESTSGKYHFALSLVWVEEKPFVNLHVCNIISFFKYCMGWKNHLWAHNYIISFFFFSCASWKNNLQAYKCAI